MSVVSLTGSGDGDVRERAGGGQEEPERGAGRECEAVSATGGGGWPRPSSGEGVPPGRAGPGCCAARSSPPGLQRVVSVRQPQRWPGPGPLCAGGRKQWV